MNMSPEHIPGFTTHTRLGQIKNAFRYGVDFVLIAPESRCGPVLFSRNKFNLASVHDSAHGGKPNYGRGAVWARDVLAKAGFEFKNGHDLLLLTQPRFLGYIFNPVSFWLVMEGNDLLAAIVEVNNTFGDRHSYLCHLPDFAPILKTDKLRAEKVFHVSPFQEIAGDYSFTFDIQPDRIAIRIIHRNGPEGVTATLTGPRTPLTNLSILRSNLRRPFGAIRTIVLIYLQAIRLKLKAAPYRTRPAPPKEEVS